MLGVGDAGILERTERFMGDQEAEVLEKGWRLEVIG